MLWGVVGVLDIASVPQRLLAALARARRGLLVLAVDGLSYRCAAQAWAPGRLDRLASTVPSTSATAWLTAVTGAGPERHGVPGMVYRVPGTGELVYAVTGHVLASGPVDAGGSVRLVEPVPTVFECAGVRCLALGRELDTLPGPWAAAVLRGATREPAAPATELARQAAEPGLLVEAVIADVGAVVAGPSDLIWVYVNLDDHVHRYGYDAAAVRAMRRLGQAAEGWATAGWTVVAHSDHGQVRCRPDPVLARAWEEADNPRECLLPAGGAGRMRWLYPRPGRADALASRLAGALGPAATVHRPADLGLPTDGRVGTVVALAASPAFPLPDPGLACEHGGSTEDEIAVPFATWS
jgi:hypothetical protein